LCATCAGAEGTASDAPAAPPAGTTSITFTAGPEPATLTANPAVTGRPGDRAPLPHAPAGYDLLDRLGSGGMGAVYLAREHAAERLVAMKFLHEPGDPSGYDRFLVEVRVLAQLDHPGIVRVFSSDFLRVRPFFTMEYVPGGPLSRRVAEGNPLPADEAARLIRRVAEAVAAAHARGVVHRDLKPSNVLLAADGSPKVSDFGLAKRLDRDDGLTVGSGALGTAAYMPPEQVSRRNGEVGAWSDVYGLGATLYHLLTGRAPFCGETGEETIFKVLSDPPVRPRALRPDIPAALEAVVLKCLEKDPKDRYRSAAEFAEDLDRYFAGQKPLAPELTRRRRAKQWARRHRRGVFAAAAAVVLLAGVFALGAAVSPKPPPTPAPAEAPAPIPDEVRAPDGRLLPFRVRLGHDKSKVTAAADGTITVSTWGMCLVEYTPGKSPARYRLRASVRHEASAVGGRVGLYFAHRTHPGQFGDLHLFGHLTYNDVRLYGDQLAAPPPVPLPLPKENRVRLVFQVRGAGRERPWNGQSELAVGAPFPPRGWQGDLWRAIAVHVSPDEVSGTWQSRPVGSAAAMQINAAFAENLTDGRRRHPDDRLLPPPEAARFDPQGGFGLFVENGSASFRAIELTPDQND
jgi:serine/threonine-protein kinase